MCAGERGGQVLHLGWGKTSCAGVGKGGGLLTWYVQLGEKGSKGACTVCTVAGRGEHCVAHTECDPHGMWPPAAQMFGVNQGC